MADDTNVLTLQDVTYGFEPGKPIVEQVSFTVRKGEFVALLGASGTGKSTLFQLISGLLEPEVGTITVTDDTAGSTDRVETSKTGVTTERTKSPNVTDRRSLFARGTEEVGRNSRLGRVSYMPQTNSLLPWRTVLDNAALGPELRGVGKREAHAAVRKLLREFGLEGSERKYPHELSGGMRQRVAFLRSMLCGTELMLLDEPFSALDAMTRVALQEWLLNIWENHRKTILFITHDIEEAILLSDRIAIVNETPIRHIAEIRNPLARPRSYASTLEPSFLTVKKQVLKALWGEHAAFEAMDGPPSVDGSRGSKTR